MQNAKAKSGGAGKTDLDERLLQFAARCIRFGAWLGRTGTGKVIAMQLVRCSSSAGANYEEACGAESRADFLHKLQLVLKEIRESRYWLRLAQKSQLVSEQRLRPLQDESNELVLIFSKSVVTAKANTGERA